MKYFTCLWTFALFLIVVFFPDSKALGLEFRGNKCIEMRDSLAPPDSTWWNQLKLMNDELSDVKTQLHSVSLLPPNEASMKKEAGDGDERKRVKFGLSLGYRCLTHTSRSQFLKASVSPLDSTLRLTRMEGTAYLFSTSMIFDLNLGQLLDEDAIDRIAQRKSLRKSGKKFRGNRKNKTLKVNKEIPFTGNFVRNQLDRLCLVSNLNILDFSSGQNELAFNKNIEGGLGIGYRVNDTLFLGLNWEHVKSFQLYDDIKQKEGEQIVLNGSQLVNSNQLDTDNEDLFYKKSLNGWSVKMIIAL